MHSDVITCILHSYIGRVNEITRRSYREIVFTKYFATSVRGRRARAAFHSSGTGMWKGGVLLFPNNNGRHFNRSSLQTLFKKVVRDAGLPNIRFHDLRHSASTILLNMGVSAKVVQEILGHSHISITLGIYAHVPPGMHKEAMNKMDDWFGNVDKKTNPLQ